MKLHFSSFSFNLKISILWLLLWLLLVAVHYILFVFKDKLVFGRCPVCERCTKTEKLSTSPFYEYNSVSCALFLSASHLLSFHLFAIVVVVGILLLSLNTKKNMNNKLYVFIIIIIVIWVHYSVDFFVPITCVCVCFGRLSYYTLWIQKISMSIENYYRTKKKKKYIHYAKCVPVHML